MSGPEDVSPADPASLDVCAILVAHDGERWLARSLAALAALTHRPDRIVAVDTGSRDATHSLLVNALGHDRVISAPRSTGFGAAVAMALEAIELPADDTWIWLLHDDCAPESDALARLVAHVTGDRAIDVIGCRIRSWPRGRRLLEAGVTVAATGRRETGVEPGEYDQGQLDGVRHVLAVSSAGMFVRRRTWDALGGFDPRLPLFRDDVDFGIRAAYAGHRVVVVPDAVVFHAEASAAGLRSISNAASRPHRADRQAALYTLLANARPLGFGWQYLRLTVGSLLRALGYLLAKLPSAGTDEMAALASVVIRPDRLIAGRRWRKRAGVPRYGVARSLLPRWWTPYAHGADVVSSRLSGLSWGRSIGRRPRAGPVPAAGVVAWMRRHAFLGLVCCLCAGSFGAGRALIGSGELFGGALLPAPSGVGAWWRLYLQTWHPVGQGSAIVAPPYVVLLALLGSILGSAQLAVVIVMLQAVPLAAIGAYVSSGRLVASRPVRLWAAVTYALVPVTGGAVTSGHLGSVVALVALPWLVVAVAPILRQARPGWATACRAGLALTVVCAFAPIAWAMAAALVVLALPMLAARASRRRLSRLVAALALPVVLLAPWSARVIAHPGLLRNEADVVLGIAPRLAAWQLPFGRTGATGEAPWWLTCGLVIIAFAALLRADRCPAVAWCWLVAAVGLATAAVVASSSNWVGFPTAVTQAAWIAAGAIAADGLRDRMRTAAFGIRQPVAVAAAILALVTSIGTLGWWMLWSGPGELERGHAGVLPVYMADQLATDTGLHVLVIRGNHLRAQYEVVSGDGFRIGDEGVTTQTTSAPLVHLVADLLSQPRRSDVRALAHLGFAYIALPRPADPTLVTVLDSAPGLKIASTRRASLDGWQIPHPSRAHASSPVGLARHRKAWLAAELTCWVIAGIGALPTGRRRAGLQAVRSADQVWSPAHSQTGSVPPGRAASLSILAAIAVSAAAVVVVADTPGPQPLVLPSPEAVPVDAVTLSCPGGAGTASALTVSMPYAGPAAPGAGRLEVRTRGGSAASISARGDAEETPIPADGLSVDARGGLAPGTAASQVTTADRSRLAISPCRAGASQWWFNGADTSTGATSRLILVNPTPAVTVVDLSFFGPRGIVRAAGSRGIALAPGSRRVIDLASYAPGVSALTVVVNATQGLVTAAVLTSYISGDTPTGIEWIPASMPPARDDLVNACAAEAADAVLDITNPGDREALVTISVIDSSGHFVPTGDDAIRVEPGAVVQQDLTSIADGESVAVRLTSNVPVTAATTTRSRSGDVAISAASTPLSAPASAPILPGFGLSVAFTSGKSTPSPVTLAVYDGSGRRVSSSRLVVDDQNLVTWSPPRGPESGSAGYVVVTVGGGASTQVQAVSLYTADGGVAALPLQPSAFSILRPAVTRSVDRAE